MVPTTWRVKLFGRRRPFFRPRSWPPLYVYMKLIHQDTRNSPANELILLIQKVKRRGAWIRSNVSFMFFFFWRITNQENCLLELFEIAETTRYLYYREKDICMLSKSSCENANSLHDGTSLRKRYARLWRAWYRVAGHLELLRSLEESEYTQGRHCGTPEVRWHPADDGVTREDPDRANANQFPIKAMRL